MPLRTHDFESCASASSATPAVKQSKIKKAKCKIKNLSSAFFDIISHNLFCYLRLSLRAKRSNLKPRSPRPLRGLAMTD